jgi:hypothetical protein
MSHYNLNRFNQYERIPANVNVLYLNGQLNIHENALVDLKNVTDIIFENFNNEQFVVLPKNVKNIAGYLFSPIVLDGLLKLEYVNIAVNYEDVYISNCKNLMTIIVNRFHGYNVKLYLSGLPKIQLIHCPSCTLLSADTYYESINLPNLMYYDIATDSELVIRNVSMPALTFHIICSSLMIMNCIIGYIRIIEPEKNSGFTILLDRVQINDSLELPSRFDYCIIKNSLLASLNCDLTRLVTMNDLYIENSQVLKFRLTSDDVDVTVKSLKSFYKTKARLEKELRYSVHESLRNKGDPVTNKQLDKLVVDYKILDYLGLGPKQ